MQQIQMAARGIAADKDGSSSLLSRHAWIIKVLLVGVPILLLSIAVIVLAVILSQLIAKSSRMCATEDCVATAGQILASMNPKVDPCTDFYQYSCGGYERKASIPTGYSRYSLFDEAQDILLKDLRSILETPSPPDEASSRAKARRFYKACMNTTSTNSNSVAALKNVVTQLGGFLLKSSRSVPANWSLNKLLKRRNKFTIRGFFDFEVSVDAKNVSHNILQISQGILGLGYGTRDYYIGKNVTGDPILIAYAEMLKQYANLLEGEGEVESETIYDILRFEQDMAQIQLPNSQLRDQNVLYHRWNITWFDQEAPFINWLSFFRSLLSDLRINSEEPVILYSTPEFIRNLTVVVRKYLSTERGKRTIHNYMVFQPILSYAPHFGDEFRAAYDRFQGIFSGKQGSLPTWHECIVQTDDAVGFGLGAVYIEDYFHESSKTSVEFIIGGVRAAFRKRITALDWMDEQTKEAALGKIDALRYEAAFPKWIKNETYLEEYYADLQVTDSFIDNKFSTYTFWFNDHFSSHRKPPNPDVWHMTPQTVNAYFMPTQNKFFVPAGILVRPFFAKGSSLPIVVNFAAIGVVIGHEIGHGFDDSGSQFNKDGNFDNWWTNDTYSRFSDKAQCLVDQYNKFEMDGHHLNGKQSLGENIGDNGGVNAAFEAYLEARGAHPSSMLAGLNLNDEQLFFVSFAQMWCSLFTPQSLQKQITQGYHPPGKFRVNGPVSNSEGFARAFQCPENAPMNPKAKCTVW